MYKMVLIMLMMAVWMAMHALQTDEEIAMTALYQGKHAVNRAAHAAAQQVDRVALADGRLHIDEAAAYRNAGRYLQTNLQLNGDGEPLPESMLRDRVEVLVFEVINDDHVFPYTYRNSYYGYTVTLKRPGVVLIVRMIYPRIFNIIEPIEWTIKGTAELVAR
ncbi:hypothetical protein [Paenibacillus nasutitermitis]|uniref:Uncharacterized protein n=1 Tax=Paenibacillus nasutitermitis TaxID=1652958 RepID=A0A917E502_9BACL|nr:hypothetical protein [Paenibacillus nasutitermitis]GGE01775.1 hypothetical protein GCM10010911_70930 [Paenibacillus nasutitermitis]